MPRVEPPAPAPMVQHGSKPLSQQQRIVAIMCIEANTKKWWKAHELISYGDPALFVGYEAGPRLSELTKNHPEIFETKQEGKFLLRRMKFEEGKDWYPNAPKEIQTVIKRYYHADR